MDDFHGDPADKIIVATTNCLGAITRDKKETLSWVNLRHIKSISI